VTTDTVLLLAERELVIRAQSGDLDAMHDLIVALRPAVFKFCRFRLAPYGGGSDAADDAAQETCLAVANVLSDYRDQGLPFRAWVFAIAANKVADAQRRFGRSPILVDEFPEQVETSPTPEELVIASVELTAALELVEQLPTTMREVLLRRAGGATAKAVADDLGMSQGAVNVAHHRAVSRLRELADGSEEHRELFAGLRGRQVRRSISRAA
jgi:RNA polymerase sigma-70 factor (ECF subfamily)